MTISRGDVILLDVPFSDRTGIKKRPAVIISNDFYNAGCADVIVQAITSQTVKAERFPGGSEIKDWRAAGLLKPSWVKGQLYTIDRGLLHRRLGRLSASDLSLVETALREILF